MAHYILNFAHECAAEGQSSREVAAARLRAGMWGVAEGEKHRGALSDGDLVLVYVAAPERQFIGRAVLASPVRAWPPSDAQAFPSRLSAGVLLTQVEEWDPPVPMSEVLQRIDQSQGARADFEASVVRITESEYQAAVAVASERMSRPRGQ